MENDKQFTGNQEHKFAMLDSVPIQQIVDNARSLHDVLYAPHAPITAHQPELIEHWADLHNYLIDGIVTGKLTLARLPSKP